MSGESWISNALLSTVIVFQEVCVCGGGLDGGSVKFCVERPLGALGMLLPKVFWHESQCSLCLTHKT